MEFRNDKSLQAGRLQGAIAIETQAAFLTLKLRHQPSLATKRPPKNEQGPQSAVGAPEYSWHVLHFCSTVCRGYLALSTLVVSILKPMDLA